MEIDSRGSNRIALVVHERKIIDPQPELDLARLACLGTVFQPPPFLEKLQKLRNVTLILVSATSQTDAIETGGVFGGIGWPLIWVLRCISGAQS